MNGIPPHTCRKACFPRTSAILTAGTVVFLLATIQVAAAAEEVPEGIEVGNWVVAPYLITGYSFETNPFYRSDEGTIGPIEDTVLELNPGFKATLPFRNSSISLHLDQNTYRYRENEVEEDQAYDVGADLSLLFSTYDRLSVKATRNTGLAQSVVFDEGGEAVFDGSPFDMNTFEFKLSREEYGRRGYLFQIKRQDLNFKETTARFFDFRGLDWLAQYRQPISPRQWLLISYQGRLYDHYLVTDPVGVSYREEDSSIAYLGLMARFNLRRSYTVRLGHGTFRFPGSVGSDYTGIVGDGQLNLGLGASFRLVVDVMRRPYPSFFRNNNFYVGNRILIRLERDWRNRTRVGLATGIQRSRYGDRLVSPGDPQEGIIRKDDTLTLEAYATLMIRDRLGLRLSAQRRTRSSNYTGVDYDANTIFAGIAIGWL